MTKHMISLLALMMAVSSVGTGQTPVNPEAILDHQGWGKIYEEHACNPDHIKLLEQRIQEPVTIEVYFAFWCIDSEENVPKFLKIIKSLDSTNVTVNYFTVGRKPSRATVYYVEKLKVTRIPTFIFYRDGVEIGRIVEQPAASLSEDMAKIL